MIITSSSSSSHGAPSLRATSSTLHYSMRGGTASAHRRRIRAAVPADGRLVSLASSSAPRRSRKVHHLNAHTYAREGELPQKGLQTAGAGQGSNLRPWDYTRRRPRGHDRAGLPSAARCLTQFVSARFSLFNGIPSPLARRGENRGGRGY